MSYCINPWCAHRENPDPGIGVTSPQENRCQTCGTPLLIQGRYRLIRPLRELDEWEPSEIFEITDRGRRKVLKVLKKSILLPLFEREVTTLQQLDHPGIPQVDPDGYFSLQLSDGRELHCLVMEKIRGVNLDDWLQKNGPINPAMALDWMYQLVELLALLHKTELFHRDIKLSNIMRRSTNQLALIDFGTVRRMTSTYFAKVAGQRDITSVVSPGYTPLEQINGKAVPQSDFYALGRSFVHLLTGEHPIDLPEDDNTGRLTWRDRLPEPIPDWLAQLLDDMMAPFPGQRPLNTEVILERLNKQQPIQVGWSEKQQLRLLVAANMSLLILQLLIGWQWVNTRQQLEERSQRLNSDEFSFVMLASLVASHPLSAQQ
ncbi:MAG: serine/threonine protein kinase [Leptolyngbya sp. SIO1D8]|nr:serine/threonine protein kinase [Leptolyngbya sp. SIO1D8]